MPIFVRQAITWRLAADRLFCRVPQACLNFFDAFDGDLAVVGGGYFGEPVEQCSQDLVFLAGAIMPTAGRSRSCGPVVAVLGLWVVTLGALPGALRADVVLGLFVHGVSGMASF
jgi:hypothetical protein